MPLPVVVVPVLLDPALGRAQDQAPLAGEARSTTRVG